VKYSLWRKGETLREKIVKAVRLFISFSSEGEDKILLELLPKKGTYLDIGAHHPFWISNTALLYLRGWSGVNVDILNKWKFKLFRPRDKFIYGYIEANMSYLFPRKLHTSDKKMARDRMDAGWKWESKRVPRYSITDFTGYDALFLDVDGIEVEIITKLMKHYKPPFVIVENLFPEQKPVDGILYKNGYRKICQTVCNGIFKLG